MTTPELKPFCHICGRVLKNPKYQLLGIGPVCLKKKLKKEKEEKERAAKENTEHPRV